MRKSLIGLVYASAALALAAGPAASQTVPIEAKAAPSASSWPRVTQPADPGPRQYSARARGTFAGRTVRYMATLSELLVKDRAGKAASSLFITSFAGDPAPGPVDRPVLFIFNGGPGGSSNTLMFGALGPERLQRFDAAARSDPDTSVVANEDTVLDVADLVFIDAPETGFGRPLPGSDPTTFRSNDGDSFAFSQVILRWLNDAHRMSSPVYIVGESYGSIRAVALARDLSAATPPVELAGLILVSQALRYNGPDDLAIKHVDDAVRLINALPDIAALSWYHGLVENRTQTLAQAIATAQDYAVSEYAQVLLAGDRLSVTDRWRAAERLSALTGLSVDFLMANNLRLENVRRQLLAGRNLALDQFDGRDTEPLQGAPEDADRDWVKATRGLTHASERLASETFGAKGLPPYRTIVPDPYGFEKTWKYVTAPAPGSDLILREQMTANPRLRLLVTQGVFDTTTPMGETDFLFSQLGAAKDRTAMARYIGGHMLYSDDAGRRAFLNDLRAFLTGQPLSSRGVPSATPGTPARDRGAR